MLSSGAPLRASTSAALAGDGSAATPGLSFTSTPSQGLYRASTTALGLAANGTTVALVSGVTSAVNYINLTNAITAGFPALIAAGSDANIALAIVPKGTGAITAAVPDSGVTGGNARGTNAVDWQTTRAAATQVASGTNSHIGGGLSNTASGAQSVVAGGQSGNASGANATISGGFTNTASAARATVGGGSVNIADADSACIPGGQRATTRATFGKMAFASGMFSVTGDAQMGEHVLRRQTVDATSTLLTADGGAPTAANQVTLPNNSVFRIDLELAARQPATGDVGTWTNIRALVKRGASAATTVIYGGVAAFGSEVGDTAPMANWKVTTGVDTTNGCLTIAVVGEAAKTILWVARVRSVEVVG